MNKYITLERSFLKRLLPIFIILTFLIILLSQFNEMISQYSGLQDKLNTQLQRLIFDVTHPLWNLNYTQLDDLAEIVLLDEDTVGISIFNENDEVITSRGVSTGRLIKHLDNWIEEERENPYSPDFSTLVEILLFNKNVEKQLIASSKINFQTDGENYYIGTIYLIYSDLNIVSKIRSDFFSFFIFSIVVFLLFTALIFISYRSIVTTPLKNLQESILNATESSKSFNIPRVSTSNEIEYLKILFNELWRNQSKLSEELKESKDFYHQLLESLPIAVVLSDQKGNIVFHNKAFIQIISYSDDEIKDIDIWEIIPEKYHPMEKEIRSKIQDSDQNFSQEQELINKTGKSIPVSIKRSLISKENKNFYWYSIEDISNRLATQKFLEQNERFLNETAAFAKVGGWEYNDEEKKLYWTDEIYKIHELENDYSPSLRSSNEFYHPEDRKYITDAIDSALKQGTNFEIESRLITAHGKQIWVTTKGKPVFTKNKISGVMGTFQDITSRKEAEKEKTELQKQVFHMNKVEMLGQLAGGIAHDFNNLLTPIIGYVEIALNLITKKSILQEYLNQVLNASKRAADLVNQILTFSHNNDLDLRPMEIQIIIKEVLKLFRASTPSNIQVHQNINSDCGFIMADSTHIHQIVMNLCTNALHAMEGMPQGNIYISYDTVSLSKEDLAGLRLSPGSYVCLSVEDTGRGMDQEIADRIFEPYFTTKEKKKGTGLGLAITHKIIKDYGGCIGVSSIKDQGTIFKIYFPQVKNNQKSSDLNPAERNLKTGSEHILLIDDEYSVAEMEKTMLETLGYTVTMKTSSAEGLDYFILNSNTISLVITDMTMPEMTGDILAKKMMNINKSIPIIIITGFSETFTENDAREDGIKDYLLKPITMEKLSISVKNAIGSHSFENP